MMTLENAIEKYETLSKYFSREGCDETERGCARRYNQLSNWLKKLKMYREKEDDGR